MSFSASGETCKSSSRVRRSHPFRWGNRSSPKLAKIYIGEDFVIGGIDFVEFLKQLFGRGAIAIRHTLIIDQNFSIADFHALEIVGHLPQLPQAD